LLDEIRGEVENNGNEWCFHDRLGALRFLRGHGNNILNVMYGIITIIAYTRLYLLGNCREMSYVVIRLHKNGVTQHYIITVKMFLYSFPFTKQNILCK